MAGGSADRPSQAPCEEKGGTPTRGKTKIQSHDAATAHQLGKIEKKLKTPPKQEEEICGRGLKGQNPNKGTPAKWATRYAKRGFLQGEGLPRRKESSVVPWS